MIVIADSGSTSIDWRILDGGVQVRRIVTAGVNPVYQGEEEMRRTFQEALSEYSGEKGSVYFYGAGVLSDNAAGAVRKALCAVLPGFGISTGSDLEAAARAVLGDEDGIVAIIGTGSNSGLYVGGSIVRNVPAGGYILGDEGSGAWLGRRLLSDYIKGMMPEALQAAMRSGYEGLDYPAVVEKVYRGTMPSRYLASFSPFLKRHEKEEYVKALLNTGFREFLQRNVLRYGRPDLPLAAVGSVAAVYADAFRSAAAELGVNIIRIETSAGDGLVRYFQNHRI